MPDCGRGHEARLLAERDFSMTGIDISTEALREARKLDQPGAEPMPGAWGNWWPREAGFWDCSGATPAAAVHHSALNLSR